MGVGLLLKNGVSSDIINRVMTFLLHYIKPFSEPSVRSFAEVMCMECAAKVDAVVIYSYVIGYYVAVDLVWPTPWGVRSHLRHAQWM